MIKNITNIVLIIFSFIIIFSCSENVNETSLIDNQSPNTSLFLFPDDPDSIRQQKSRLQVHWWGDDPDGLIRGYYFRWVGLQDGWSFTTSNDSIFSLPIGTSDTTFLFQVTAADQEGNGKYDQSIIRNGTDYGVEPFIDENSNGIWDEGEHYFDIGAVDPTPAEQKFPIKNSSPVINWDKESDLPLESFPVMTVGWIVNDLDGLESIVNINIAINDTNQFVPLDGHVRLVTLRIKDLNADQSEMEILINGSEDNIFSETLKGLILDANNRLFIQAVDISGASSPFTPLPDTSRDWYVKKPKGDLLIVDDFAGGDNAQEYYNNLFDNMSGGAFIDKYDLFDIEATSLPYSSITFLETLKLFKYLYWYSDSTPSLEFTSSVTQKYIIDGGKIAYSLTFQDSSASFTFDLATLQSFLPIEALGEESPLSFLFPGANLISFEDFNYYPQLRTETTVGFVRTYIPSSLSASGIHNLSSNQINGTISLIDNSKSLFFIGLPLHQCDGILGNVQTLMEVVLIDEFGLTP